MSKLSNATSPREGSKKQILTEPDQNDLPLDWEAGI